MPLLRQAGDAQQAGHDARQQHFSMTSTAPGKQRRKAQNDRGKAGRKLKHGSVSWRGRTSLAAYPPHHPTPAMAKVELGLAASTAL